MNLYIYIIIIHFVGDWMLQRRKVAENKTTSILAMGEHVILVALSLLPLFLFSKTSLYSLGIYLAVHVIQDLIVWKTFIIYAKSQQKLMSDPYPYWKSYWFYFTIALDQILHLTLLIILVNNPKV